MRRSDEVSRCGGVGGGSRSGGGRWSGLVWSGSGRAGETEMGGNVSKKINPENRATEQLDE